MWAIDESGLLPTDWGGDVEVVKTSAINGTGIDDLLETVFTIAELHDLKANSHRPAVGTCLEAEVHEGRGVVAKLIVQKGTLKVGDAIVCGTATGHVKAMYDTLDEVDETFTVNLANPTNATVSDGTGLGTITDNDATPTLSISDVTVNEGSGTAIFTVTDPLRVRRSGRFLVIAVALMLRTVPLVENVGSTVT